MTAPNIKSPPKIEHHTHYKEIHGYDETIWVTWSEHYHIHQRIQAEGGWGIPPDEMEKIVQAAHQRTTKRIVERRHYKRDYTRQNMQRIEFYDTLLPSVQHREAYIYNNLTNHLLLVFDFKANNGKKLWLHEVST